MEFMKLADVEVVETATETDKVLIEQNGEIKRVPKTEVGGGGAIKTVIIKSSDYDNAIAGVQTMSSAPEITYECINMTFEEAYQTMASGEPLGVMGMLVSNNASGCTTIALTYFAGTMNGVPCIVISFIMPQIDLYWTANGLSTDIPGDGGEE